MRLSRLGTIAAFAASLTQNSSCAHRSPPIATPCIVDAGAGDCGGTVALGSGCRMQIALTPLASSGYVWRVASATASMFTTRELPPRAVDPIGVDTRRQQVFEIVPLRVGEGRIVLRHERPFDPGDRPEICTIAVPVAP